MLDELAIAPLRCVSIEEAIRAVLAGARQRGVPEPTLYKMRRQAAYLTQFWKPSAPMTRIDRDEVLEFIRVSREEGRSPNTLLQKDLPMLARCFAMAKIPSPVAKVREELRQTLKYVPPTMHFFELYEIRDLLQRMRTSVFRRQLIRCRHCETEQSTVLEQRPGVDQPRQCKHCDRRFTVRSTGRGKIQELPQRHRQADLIEFLALTGIRSGELSRLTVGAMDQGRNRIRVISKDRGHPRWVEVVGPLVAIVGRLIAEATDRAEAAGREPADEPLVPSSMGVLSRLCRDWKVRLCEPRIAGRTFRHSFVTGVLQSGGGAREASSLAGHRKLDTTDRYVHEITDARARRIEALARALDPDAEPEADE